MRVKTLNYGMHMGKARVALLGTVVAVAMIAGGSAAKGSEQEQNHAAHASATSSKLVGIVRNATRQFMDVNVAVNNGYQAAFGCVSGPDHGAMGVHYIHSGLVGDGQIDASKPEALIYEPTADGMKLVGVEFIVDAAAWLKQYSAPPTLEGQAFQLVNSPNRYGLPAFFELHVWAWRDNPNGTFSDWNTHVSCNGQ